jgi:MFS family permease
VEGQERELPMLAGISAFLHWLEEFLVIVSGPLLTAGLLIGLVDLLTDGALFLSEPWLLYVWAFAQGVGVDGQLVGAWFRVARSARRQDWKAMLGFIVLGCILGYVAFVAGWVFNFQQTFHVTTSQALGKLGFDQTSWLWQRTAVAVGLVCLSGLLRYTSPKAEPVDFEAQKEAIRQKAELDRLKAEANGQRLTGAIGNLRKAAQAARGKADGDAVPLGVNGHQSDSGDWLSGS